MNYHITSPERMVLENLAQKPLSLTDLRSVTNLESHILNNILKDFVTKNLISMENKKYQLNHNLCSMIKDGLNNFESKVVEAMSLIETSLRLSVQNEKDQFKLVKVYMNEQEEKIFNAHLHNLNTFLSSLSHKDQSNKKHKLAYFGVNNYADIINTIINN